MRSHRIHADEIEVDTELVRRLLRAQLPRWADLPLERVPSWGTDNALFRLGDRMVARLPIHGPSAHDLEREERWLPFLAAKLPVRVPSRLARGEPGHGYPFHWCVWEWIDGESPDPERLGDAHGLALDLALLIRGLRSVDPRGGPRAGRGVPLSDPDRDGWTRAAIGRLRGVVDIAAVTAAWEAALRVPAWDRDPVWVHGDLTPGNLVCAGDRLRAVIDWGGDGVGDPACDLLPAWNLLTSDARTTFRDALAVDDATWERGRGWALSTALIALPYYLDTNTGMVRMAERKLTALFGPGVLARR